MHTFEVWAPRATAMSVKLADALIPMQGPDERGCWTAAVDGAQAGTDYSYRIDGDEMDHPDPRSCCQPYGPHGVSRLYDQTSFVWDDEHWQAPPLGSGILYELHIGTFTPEGTFDSAISRLDYLYRLGVTHIELMPVATYAGDRGWGYDGVALFAVTENYGGPDGLKRLVNACHARGLAVLLDVVYNHFGPVGNYAGKFAPYLTSNHRTPWGEAVNFEGAGSDEVRRFFCDNAMMWLRDFHIDGLRLDAVHEFVDRSAIHFMEQLTAEIDVLASTLGARKVLIAESDLNDPRVIRSREATGFGMDAQWSDDFHHAFFTLLHGQTQGGYYADFGTFEKLAKALTSVFVYDGAYSKYRMRRHGRPVEGLSAHRFVCFLQNHDQVGNRATGDRLEQIVGMERAKAALGLLLTAPFIPLLFMGEEFAASTPFLYFADHEDPEMAQAVSAGRKQEFAAFGFGEQEVPDPEVRSTFERSRLDWNETHEGHHAEMLEWVRTLIHFRRQSPSLNDGDLGHLSVRYDEERHWLAMDRGQVQVLLNLGSEDARLEVPGGSAVVLATRPGLEVLDGFVAVPPNALAIVSQHRD